MIPVQTQILDEIGARLALITVANGYLTRTPKKIVRSMLTPLKNSDLPFINYYSTADNLSNKEYGTIEKRILTVAIESYDATRDQVFDDLAQKLGANILVALNRSTGSPAVADNPSVNLGGLVGQVEVTSITPAIGEGQTPYAGIVLFLDVTYKVDKLDPFTLINI